MQRREWSLFVAALFAAFLSASNADAQQLKPYFLVIFDTSGSMAWCSGGNESQFGSNDCSCLTSGGPCFGQTTTHPDSAFRLNRCGFPSNRLGDAKCALQRIVDATSGDAVFGLMQFEHPCSNTCSNATLSSGGANCGATQDFNDGQLVVAIQNNNTTLLREWVDGSGNCQGTCTDSYRRELTAGVFTPITRSLQRANEYLRGTPQGGFLYPTNPAGFNAAPPAPLANDPQLACRPVSVILLTDGKDTCTASPTNDPPAAAEALMGAGNIYGSDPASKAFRTYVIGFGGSGDSYDPTTLNNIAMRGGTEQFYPAANEAQLSAVLNQIIADAQPPVEVCNDKDDDCDGNFDEGIQKFCDLPGGVTAEILCEEPNEKNCDGMDDDCDGIIDEGLTNVCGACGEVPAEVCDGVDNDCDLRIDEEASTLEACGNDTGECEAGRTVCIEGMEQCEGEVGPGDEICDCKDNDCDGSIDENGGEGLCPEDQTCAGCQCVPYCKPIQEFGQTCAAGLAPDVQSNGECICVVDNCDNQECARQTIRQGDEVVCAPDHDDVGTCVCRAGTCVQRCVGVTCGDGEICSPKTGQCVEDNCRGLGCDGDELCDPMSTMCVEDKCATASCADGEVCRGGTCEASCAGVTCERGERCARGACVEDACDGVMCEDGQACDPASGECVPDTCEQTTCPRGQVCSISAGSCVADPCWDVDCPEDQSCRDGECVAATTSAGSAAPPPPPPTGRPTGTKRFFATGGGGGCACSVPGPERTASDTQALLLLAVFGGVLGVRRAWRRRPRARLRPDLLILIASIAASSMGTSACTVSPLCLDGNCEGTGRNPSMARDSGAAGAAGDGEPEPPPSEDSGVDSGDAEADGSMPSTRDASTCEPSGPETCNDQDDDCDFKVDEGVVPPANNCFQRGVCAGTEPVCTAGDFVCRYGTDFETEESKCDGRDNDCDGKVDETFTMLGSSCEVGIGACKVTGTRKCNTAGTDLTCEVPSAVEPGEEVCNGVDDDCDGAIDEPKGEPGMNPSYVRDDLVQVGSSLWVYKYEASRADATATVQGKLGDRACSRTGVMPWTDLTFEQAEAACAASGLALCSVQDWTTACRGGSGTCKWSYTSESAGCNAYETEGSDACNGHDVTAEPGSADSDALKPAGSMPECYADFGSAGGVYDLSGNAKEWTRGPMSPEQNPLRGGSYNNAPMGLQCDFDFSVGGREVRLPNIGFRCCTSTAP